MFSSSSAPISGLRKIHYIGLLLAFCYAGNSNAETLRLAVASNFAGTIGPLKTEFEQQSSHQLQISLGSSGKHYAQILHGAPFDVFLAADSERPQRLAIQLTGQLTGQLAEQATSREAPFTYALGRLALWQPGATEKPSLEQLAASKFLAVANPKLAPYGQAAVEYLQQRPSAPSPHQRYVYGENVAQTYQFAASGQAHMALLAYSQVINKPAQEYRLLDSAMHGPITQQALLLREGPAATAFVQFLQSPPARRIIQAHGYLVPDLQ